MLEVISFDLIIGFWAATISHLTVAAGFKCVHVYMIHKHDRRPRPWWAA